MPSWTAQAEALADSADLIATAGTMSTRCRATGLTMRAIRPITTAALALSPRGIVCLPPITGAAPYPRDEDLAEELVALVMTVHAREEQLQILIVDVSVAGALATARYTAGVGSDRTSSEALMLLLGQVSDASAAAKLLAYALAADRVLNDAAS
jgi:hypothetical protein